MDIEFGEQITLGADCNYFYASYLELFVYLKTSAGLPYLPSINSGARYLGSPSWASEKSLPWA